MREKVSRLLYNYIIVLLYNYIILSYCGFDITNSDWKIHYLCNLGCQVGCHGDNFRWFSLSVYVFFLHHFNEDLFDFLFCDLW